VLNSFPHAGEAFALLTALSWAFAVVLFRKSGERAHPLALNLFKNALGATLFLPTLWLAGETLFRHAPARDYLLLLASGALGIGLGDTFYFLALNRLGAGRSAIVGCLYSPFVITLAVIFLGERLSAWQLVGTALIVTAVLTEAYAGGAKVTRKHLAQGIAWGVAAEVCMAVGIIIAKPILDRSPLIWTTEVRLAGGLVALAAVFLAHPRRRAILATVKPGPGWGYTVGSSFVGAYLAMGFWLAGMKYTFASLAAALNQTSTVFVVLLAAAFLHERITPRRALGVLLGVGGALFVTLA